LPASGTIHAGANETFGAAWGTGTAAEAWCAAVVTDVSNTRESGVVALPEATRLTYVSAGDALRAAHSAGARQAAIATVSGATVLIQPAALSACGCDQQRDQQTSQNEQT
jgi:hypothetical protein